MAHSGQGDACLNSLRHPGGILVSFPRSASRCQLDSKLVSKMVEDISSSKLLLVRWIDKNRISQGNNMHN